MVFSSSRQKIVARKLWDDVSWIRVTLLLSLINLFIVYIFLLLLLLRLMELCTPSNYFPVIRFNLQTIHFVIIVMMREDRKKNEKWSTK